MSIYRHTGLKIVPTTVNSKDELEPRAAWLFGGNIKYPCRLLYLYSNTTLIDIALDTPQGLNYLKKKSSFCTISKTEVEKHGINLYADALYLVPVIKLDDFIPGDVLIVRRGSQLASKLKLTKAEYVEDAVDPMCPVGYEPTEISLEDKFDEELNANMRPRFTPACECECAPLKNMGEQSIEILPNRLRINKTLTAGNVKYLIQTGDTSSVEIKYCPLCGRNLHEQDSIDDAADILL